MELKTAKELLSIYKIPMHEKILEIGCGSGDFVWKLKQEGINVSGIDVEFKKGDYTENLQKTGDIRTIITGGNRSTVKENNQVYTWPVESNSITAAFSSSVIEHVANIDEFAHENARVLRKGGIVFHYFPSRTALVEAHTGIAFGGIIQNYFYYKIACKIGKTYKKFSNDPVKCFEYMKKYTHYRSINDLKETFKRHGLYYVKDYSEKTVKSKGHKITSKIIQHSNIAKFMFNFSRSNLIVLIKK